ncbi:MAG: DHA2 family efflux MFS transporter permease subunit [Pseudomonadota bacterium]|nr:DHA2 family efflux MFS transporter permease subunit [Pseudomonadota bacterium]
MSEAAAAPVHAVTRSPHAGAGEVSPWFIAFVVAMTTFMEVLDISIANVSLRHIAGDLSAGQDESTWVLTSYLVTNAIVLPISGWFAYVVGRRTFYLWCVVVFTVSSLLCGLAPTLPMLILFRTLQGIGGGGLQPISQAILSDSFPPAKRGMAFAVYGITTVLAPAIGPTLGGWITDNFSWRWIFFINVPVGVIAFALSRRLVWDPPHLVQAQQDMRARGFHIDYLGFGLLALGFGCLQVVLDKGQQDDWFESAFIIRMAVVSAVCLFLLPFWELRQRDPMMDLRLLLQRNFLISNLLMFVLGFVLMGSTLLLPLFVQTLLGYSATQAGLVLSPGGVAILFVMPIVGALVTRVDVRALISFGLLIGALALFLFGRIDLAVDYQTVALIRVVQALGLAFLFIPINTAAFAGIPLLKSSSASAIINLSRNLGGSFGIALISSQLVQQQQRHQTYLVAHVGDAVTRPGGSVAETARSLMAQGVPALEAQQQALAHLYAMVQRQASMLSYIDAFHALALLFLLLVPACLLLRRPAPPKGPLAAH